jgi:hypothetical protein
VNGAMNHSFVTIRNLWIVLFWGIWIESVPAQTSVPFDGDGWEIDSQQHLLLQYQGKEALYLYNGSAILRDVSLRNGIIEFDIAFSGERGFTGVVWRMTDPLNFEDFYLRPHQSGNPDANQYTPVFNGISGWQLYHGEGYASPITYPLNRWIHVKVVFWEDQAQVFIDNMHEPAVQIPELKHMIASGRIGLRAFTTPAYFSGFSFRPIDTPPFERLPLVYTETPEGMIVDWEVSDPFEELKLEPVGVPDEKLFAGIAWRELQSEVTGITNLARLSGIENGNNSVFARVMIQSDREQIKKLGLGYSDKVKVYVNGRLVYSGDNTFTSRDYRYLGTIGLFDEIYLPLRPGENEVRFAVTEAFGGWGIMARIEDRGGIQIKP